jgi:putative phage-type endonuclease
MQASIMKQAVNHHQVSPPLQPVAIRMNGNIMQEVISRDGLLDRLLAKKMSVDQVINIVNHCFTSGKVVTKDDVAVRKETIKGYQQQLEHLLQLPKIEQRTDVWYAVRKTLITASEFAQALGKGKFGTQKEFYQKKCGHEVDKPFNASLAPLKWGTMFEASACEIYAGRTGQTIHEFGLLKHPSIQFFGASPDGITNNGIMLEIKCPYQRKITGEVPAQYNYQIQGQLSVCQLKECDYVECGFQDFGNIDDCFNAAGPEQEIGVIIEWDNENGDGYTYAYSPIYFAGHTDEEVCAKKKSIMEWIDKNKKQTTTSRLGSLHFWVLDVFNIVRVYRDDPFLEEQFAQLELVWDKLAEYKIDKELYLTEVGASGSRRKRAVASTVPATKDSGYLFIDD